jgi:hypothetical protein
LKYTIQLFEIDQRLTRFAENADLFTQKAIGRLSTLLMHGKEHVTEIDFERIAGIGQGLILQNVVAFWHVSKVEHESEITYNTSIPPLINRRYNSISNGKKWSTIKEYIEKLGWDWSLVLEYNAKI